MQRPRKRPKTSAQMSVAVIVFPDFIAAGFSATVGISKNL
jgi:hypothetical protein